MLVGFHLMYSIEDSIKLKISVPRSCGFIFFGRKHFSKFTKAFESTYLVYNTKELTAETGCESTDLI